MTNAAAVPQVLVFWRLVVWNLLFFFHQAAKLSKIVPKNLRRLFNEWEFVLLVGGEMSLGILLFVALCCFLLDGWAAVRGRSASPEVLNRARGGGIFVLYPVVLHLLPLVVVILDEDEDEEEGYYYHHYYSDDSDNVNAKAAKAAKARKITKATKLKRQQNQQKQKQERQQKTAKIIMPKSKRTSNST